MLFCILFSLGGAAVRYALWHTGWQAREEKARQTGIPANHTAARILYLVTGLLGQLIYWDFVLTFLQWDGMR